MHDLKIKDVKFKKKQYKNLQLYIHNNVFRAWYNPDLKFDLSVSSNYDWFSNNPRFNLEELKNIVETNLKGFKYVSIYEDDASISISIKKLSKFKIMCSIAGVTKSDNFQMISKMLDIMRHRAPDDKGIYKDNKITLGMGRLKIVDLVSENLCPYVNKDIVLSFNGEIYNFKEIKKELKELGYKFKTSSDTEVLALAWSRWGTKCFTKLNGMFAFAIYDRRKEKLYLARDIAGEKPLYYIKINNKLFFASEAKALIKTLNLTKQNSQAYNAFQHCLNETLFKNLYQIPAANYLEYDLNLKKIIKIEEYWTLKRKK